MLDFVVSLVRMGFIVVIILLMVEHDLVIISFGVCLNDLTNRVFKRYHEMFN